MPAAPISQPLRIVIVRLRSRRARATVAAWRRKTQIEAALAVARRHLGDALVAASLYGSATHGGLRRWSDLDLLLLVADRPREPLRSALMTGWLSLSGGPGTALRPLEVTVLTLTARADYLGLAEEDWTGGRGTRAGHRPARLGGRGEPRSLTRPRA